MSPISSEELWQQLKGDYLQKKQDVYVSTDGLDYTRKLVDTGLAPIRIRAAFQYFLAHTTAGDVYGYPMSRFFKQINFYLDKVRAGDGSRVKGRRTGKVQRSAYVYRCECSYELILDRQQCDGDFPDVLEEPCRRCTGRMRRVD